MDPEEEKRLFDIRLAAAGSGDCDVTFPTRTPDAYPSGPAAPCDPQEERPDEVFLPPNDPPAEPVPPSLLPDPVVVRNRGRSVPCPDGQAAVVGVSPTVIEAANPDLDVLMFLDDIAEISQDELFRLAGRIQELQTFSDDNLVELVEDDLTEYDFDLDLAAALDVTLTVAGKIREALVTAQTIADDTADTLAASQLRCGWFSRELWVTCSLDGGYTVHLTDPGGAAYAAAAAASSTISQADADDKAARVLALQELDCVAGNDEVTVTCADLDAAFNETLSWPVTPGTYEPLAPVHLSVFHGQAFMTLDEVAAVGAGKVLNYTVTIPANDPRAASASKEESDVIAYNLALQELDCFFPSRPLKFTCSELNESAALRVVAMGFTDDEMLAEMATGAATGDHELTDPDNLGIVDGVIDTVDTRVGLRAFSPAGFFTGATELEALELAEARAMLYLSCLWTSPEHVCECVAGPGDAESQTESWKFTQTQVDNNGARFVAADSTNSNTLQRGQFLSAEFPGTAIDSVTVWPDLAATCQASLTCYFDACKVVFCTPKPDDRDTKVSGDPNYASWGASWLLGPSNQAQQTLFYDAWTDHCSDQAATAFSGNCYGQDVAYEDATDCLEGDLDGTSSWVFSPTDTGTPARFKYGGVLRLEHVWRNPEAPVTDPGAPPLSVEGTILACSFSEPPPGEPEPLWQTPDPWGCFSGAEGYAKQLTPIGLGDIAMADAVSRLDCTHINWPRVIAQCPGTGQRPTENVLLEMTVEADSTRAANEQLEAMILAAVRCKEAHNFALTINGGKLTVTGPSVANVGGKTEDCLPPGLSEAVLWEDCDLKLGEGELDDKSNGGELSADANTHYFIEARCCDNADYKKLIFHQIPSDDSYDTVLNAKQRGQLGTVDSRGKEATLRATGDGEIWYLGTLGVKSDDTDPAKRKRVILQGHTGPIVMAKPCCDDASSSSDSSDSEPSSEGSSAPSEGSQGSEKSTAIVPAPWLGAGRYVAFYCVEAPEVRFEDTMELTMSSSRQVFMLDHRYVMSCETDTVRVCGGFDDQGRPARVRLHTEGNMHYVTVWLSWATRLSLGSGRPKKVLVRFTGIRKGFRRIRMAECSHEDFLNNEKFLRSARIPTHV